MYALTAFLLACVDAMVILSAYEVSCSDTGGMSVYIMLKRVGERTPS